MDTAGLPFVDDHRITIAASREQVWEALRHMVDSSLATGGTHRLGRLLGADPPCGFAMAREVPGRHIGLTGRHRFSRYLLTFDLADVTEATDVVGEASDVADPNDKTAVTTATATTTATTADAPSASTLLTAATFAVFPGIAGRVYRALVIGTRFHVLAVSRMLRDVESRALRRAGHTDA